MSYLFNNGKIAMKASGNDFTIGRPTVDKNGKEGIVGSCYCYCPAHAVKTLARKVSSAEATDLFEWLEIYAQINEDVKHALLERDTP